MSIQVDSTASVARDPIIPEVIETPTLPPPGDRIIPNVASTPKAEVSEFAAVIAAYEAECAEVWALPEIGEAPYGVCEPGGSPGRWRVKPDEPQYPFGGGTRLRPVQWVKGTVDVNDDLPNLPVTPHRSARTMERAAPGGDDKLERPVVVSGDPTEGPTAPEHRQLDHPLALFNLTRELKGRDAGAPLVEKRRKPNKPRRRPWEGFVVNEGAPVIERRQSNSWRVKEDIEASQRFYHPSPGLLRIELGIAAGRAGLTLNDLRRAFPTGRPTAEVKALREIVFGVLRPFMRDLDVTAIASVLGVSRETLYANLDRDGYDTGRTGSPSEHHEDDGDVRAEGEDEDEERAEWTERR